MPIYPTTSTTDQISKPLIQGKYYLYGTNPDQYFLVHKFIGFDSIGRVLMQTSAGPAEIIEENLDFIGPFDSQQEGITSGYKLYPNASKHYAQPQVIYYQQSYQPYGYQYYPFYRYYYPHWPWRRRVYGGWKGWKI